MVREAASLRIVHEHIPVAVTWPPGILRPPLSLSAVLELGLFHFHLNIGIGESHGRKGISKTAGRTQEAKSILPNKCSAAALGSQQNSGCHSALWYKHFVQQQQDKQFQGSAFKFFFWLPGSFMQIFAPQTQAVISSQTVCNCRGKAHKSRMCR